MDTTKRYGTAGTLSNKIQFYRTEADGNWTLDEDVILTAIVRRSISRRKRGAGIMAKTYEEKFQGIVERIENSNGTAIKFADGTMICTKRVSFSNIARTTAVGSIYTTENQELGNWAEAFIEIPTVTVTKTNNYVGFIFDYNDASTTSAGYVRFASGTSASNTNYTASVIAIGKWK